MANKKILLVDDEVDFLQLLKARLEANGYDVDTAMDGKEVKRRAEELLNRVGLGDRMHHEPSELSGGQQQRVAVARSLINRPSVLFADEPTGNLDSKTSEEVLAMFKQLNVEESITVIIVTHDPNVARHTQRQIHIHDGLIVDGQTSQGGSQ